MRRFCAALFLALALTPVRAQEPYPDGDLLERGPQPPEYAKALALQRKGRWNSAKKAFERFIRNNPDSAWVGDAELRSGDNSYLGVEQIWEGGPSERRIDVAVMGDGFTIAVGDQNLQEKWAQYCIKVLWSEDAFSEYRDYFNIFFVRLASLEEGVDPMLSPEERKKIEERNKRRTRKKKTEYNTALDAKAAGPQGQVMMNRGLVYKWLEIANADLPGCGDDRYVIAFARFGRLGMGGGGIANVGKPDKSVTVHEFGHAFSRLLDEYTGNPNPPQGAYKRTIKAANASTTKDPEKVPWAHMLKARVKGVDIIEGGATFSKGVWRPAATCAMNSAGATGFCPVCREATVLVIYEHVNPIDEHAPGTEQDVQAVEGDDTLLSVTPLQPRRHSLKADWYVMPLTARDKSPEAAPDAAVESDDWPMENDPVLRLQGYLGGRRGRGDRSAYDEPPEGEPSKLGKKVKGKKKAPPRHVFPVGKLDPGRYKITVEVRDPTRWVIKDEKHLLKERLSWWVVVAPKP